MDNVVYKLRLEATKPGRQGTVHVVKDDTGTRVIEATITSNGKPLVFDGATVALWANVAGSDQFIAGEILADKTTARVVLPTTIIEVPGEFDAELRYIETASAHVLTSAKIVIIVEANLYDSEAVEAQDNFDALASYAAMAHNAVEHYPRISGETGNWEVYDAENEEWDDTGVKAQGAKGDPGADGDKGDKGDKGDDGVSPTVTTQSFPFGTLVTITDASGEHQFLVLNGAKGDKGDNGADGNKIFVGNAVTREGQYAPPGTTAGDIYINNETYDVYRWLAVGAWGLVGNIKGAPGDTPVRGVDYWTTADQAAIVADVEADVAPKVGTLALSTGWTAGTGVYTQVVTISGVTANDAIDLYPDATVIAQMVGDGVSALYIDNNNGVLTAVCVGAALTASVSVQYRVTKVAAV